MKSLFRSTHDLNDKCDFTTLSVQRISEFSVAMLINKHSAVFVIRTVDFSLALFD